MEDNKFVSRGGVKLQEALSQFQINVNGKVCLDVGSSTGGFVDCLLQNGAEKVYAVDTAYGELAWKLRNDPRVVVLERTNILYLKSLPQEAPKKKKDEIIFNGRKDTEVIEESVKVDMVTIDAGWTQLALVLPIIKNFLKDEGFIIALLKPHYEIMHKEKLVQGVVPAHLVTEVKEQTIEKINQLGCKVKQVIDSPILGGGGNKEYLLLITCG